MPHVTTRVIYYSRYFSDIYKYYNTDQIQSNFTTQSLHINNKENLLQYLLQM